MEFTNYISVGISVLSFVGGLVSYILGLRVKQEILQNNERIDKQLSDTKDKFQTNLNALRDELIREFGAQSVRQSDRMERLDKDQNDINASLTDKILAVVNGKYVRTDLHQQSIQGIQDRFNSMKELIEVNMNKIEQGLDRQILDLKERIFDNNRFDNNNRG